MMKRWLKRTLIGVFGATVLFGGLAAWYRAGRRRDDELLTESAGPDDDPAGTDGTSAAQS